VQKESQATTLIDRVHTWVTARPVAVWLLLACVLAGMLAAALRADANLLARLAPATMVAFVFAAAAWLLRGVSASGAAAGALITIALYVSGGWPAFAALALVFVLTSAATKIGRQRKLQLGIAERSSGRTGAQVLANLSIAAMLALLAVFLQHAHLLQLASLAALSEAASDTVSSEIGEAFGKRAWLITTLQEVEVGTDGGVSPVGLLAGLVAAIAVSVLSLITRQAFGWESMLIGLTAFIGMLFDSLLGATLERRGWLTNNAVNFASTAFSGLLVILCGSLAHL
jgi:uncharacterized protein (TIGR00297 family)